MPLILSALMFVASLLILGPWGLIPLGLLLAFSTRSHPGQAEPVVLNSRRNLGLGVATAAALVCFSLQYSALLPSTLMIVGSAVLATPLALQESATSRARASAVALTRRSLILALLGLLVFVVLYQDGGLWPVTLATGSVVLPLLLGARRARAARQGGVDLGLLRHPLRRDMRAHLLRALNIWLVCALLAGVLAAGGTHHMRILLSLTAVQFDLVLAASTAGLALFAALAAFPRRRVYVASNVAVVLLSGFLSLQLTQASSGRLQEPEDEVAAVVRPVRLEVPHGAPESVVPPAQQHVAVGACLIARLLEGERARSGGVREVEDVDAAGQVTTTGEGGPPGNHRAGVPVHVGQMLFRDVASQGRRSRAVSVVAEELHGRGSRSLAPAQRRARTGARARTPPDADVHLSLAVEKVVLVSGRGTARDLSLRPAVLQQRPVRDRSTWP
jgi:hypothetical protein